MQRDHDPAERLLANGRPAGPRMDRLWARIEPQVVENKAAQKTQLRWLWLVTALAPVAAAWLFFMPSTEFRERGAESVPILDATCGTNETPCKVGEPIYLRVRPFLDGANIYVVMNASGERTLVAGPISTTEKNPTAIPSKIVPDEKDSELMFEAWLVREPISDVTTWLKSPSGTHSTLRLGIRK